MVLAHVAIYVSDLTKSKAFYDQFASILNYKVSFSDDTAVYYSDIDGDNNDGAFGLTVDPSKPIGHVHVAFKAPNIEAVKQFYEVALANGATDHGAPGFRPEYAENYYGAFVLDRDGHNIEAALYT
ncbi:Glyoxalase/Bleomycin resistance protein/Dihydroxybiphenyl dioxygenase [Lipomyces arxii]|uniref:Glyoxalase/Bleomycin resistance protein/Dihydroxybiphenyl dioxygenase n=1 Tax=Lipomyces arxii TaxID=56418 RepID=UPI0034CFE539